MKRVFIKLLVVIIFFIFLFVSFNIKTERIYEINIINQKDYILVDDFTNHLNRQYYNVLDQGNNPNNELQYYHYDNLIIEDSTLKIKAEQKLYNGYKYKSALINTKGKYEFLYGHVILKIKCPIGNGFFSAVWLLPSDDSYYPEIDIIEILGEKPNEAWLGYHYLINDYLKSSFKREIINPYQFNTYELIWTPQKLEWYINGKKVQEIKDNIPNKKMYLIINLAIGGNWPKPPDETTIFPNYLLVDYIIVIPQTINL